MALDLKYIVYHVKLEGEVVYVGHGKIGRERHADSGCSHVYELNKIHHTIGGLSVEVVYRAEEKAVAASRELSDIRSIRPRFNTVHVDTSRQVSAIYSKKVRARVKGHLDSLVGTAITQGASDKISQYMSSIFTWFKISDLLIGADIKNMSGPHADMLNRCVRCPGERTNWFNLMLSEGLVQAHVDE